jgi:TPR repeat protein
MCSRFMRVFVPGWCGPCLVLGTLAATVAAARGDADLTQDMAKAAKVYRDGCERSDAVACYYLGLTYYRGDGVPQDKSQAAAFLARACDSGLALGCWTLGNAHSTGDGVPQDKGKAVAYYQRACAAGAARRGVRQG